ncbi:hypothetical protein PLANPX_4263 [Lacipirellula parvula]|uniref:Uncharacterized protein n=1 Tax=Lacipirellula parvula TaxID=2650471 RepID=A0A5K7XI65_9BACT|nr:hypothetical protein PLANPX_4263 [Lacipirellula parvula]
MSLDSPPRGHVSFRRSAQANCSRRVDSRHVGCFDLWLKAHGPREKLLEPCGR